MLDLSPLTSCIFLETEGSMTSFCSICAAAYTMDPSDVSRHVLSPRLSPGHVFSP